MFSGHLASFIVVLLAISPCWGLGGHECSPGDDVLLLQTAVGTSRETPPFENPQPPANVNVTKVLVFWAASAKAEIRELVRSNVERFRQLEASSAGAFHFDVFLAHYDSQKETWRKEMGDWYDKNIKFAEEKKGIKFYLAKAMLLGENPACNIKDYDWLWFLDEDADMSSTNLPIFMEDAQSSGSLIVAPTIVHLSQDAPLHAAALYEQQVDCAPTVPLSPICSFQTPRRKCEYRHVNVVEVSFALMRPEAFAKVLGAKPETLSKRSIWGLDHLWCNLSAKLLGSDYQTACALVDRAPIVHRNFQTLPKYKDIAQSFIDMWQYWKVQAAYKDVFYDSYRTHECVPRAA